MGLKILHSADWHMGSPFGSFSREQGEYLRRCQNTIPQKIADLCHQEQCDLVLLAGDIFDGEPSRETVDGVMQALGDCRVPVFVAPGNHDHCGIGSLWQDAVLPENVTVFTGGMESVVLPALDCRIYGAGYQGMDCPPLLEGFRAEGNERYQLAVLHADPLTKDSPYCPVTAGQIRESGLDYLALGHIHKADSLTQGEILCLWPGCPMGRGWDETGEKGVYIVELGQQPKRRFVSLDLPRFFDLETGEALETLNDSLPARGSRDFYRITLTGQLPSERENAGSLFSRFPNLILRDRRTLEQDLWSEAGEDSLRGIYFGLLQQLSREEPAARMAAEISRKILAGSEVVLP